MSKFPVDAPKGKVIKTLERLGFSIVREKEHIAMIRENADGTKTPLTITKSFFYKKRDATNNLHASADFARRIFEGIQ
jgi:hypothetical protein